MSSDIENIDPRLRDQPVPQHDEQDQGLLRLSSPVPARPQPRGASHSRVETIIDDIAHPTSAQASHTAHHHPTKYAASQLEARSGEIEDDSHFRTRTPQYTPDSSSVARSIASQPFSKARETASAGLHHLKMMPQMGRETQSEPASSVVAVAVTDHHHQDPLQKVPGNGAHIIPTLPESRGERASEGLENNSSTPPETPSQDTTSKTPQTTPDISYYLLDESDKNELVGMAFDEIEKNLEVALHGDNLAQSFTMFFAYRDQEKRPPNRERIVDICCEIIRIQGLSNDNKALQIAKGIVGLFADTGWNFPMHERADFHDSAIIDDISQADSRFEQSSACVSGSRAKGDRPNSLTSPTPRAKVQKQRSTSAQVLAGPSSSTAGDQGLALVSTSDSGPTWVCYEPKCQNTKILSGEKTFRMHYQTHFPHQAAGCPYEDAGKPCKTLSKRPDNLKTFHLQQHAKKPGPQYDSLVKDMERTTFQITDVFHTICPFCPKRHRLWDCKTSEDHVVLHYKDGSAKPGIFNHRCSKKYHRWQCSMQIDETWRETELEEDFDHENDGTQHEPCPSESESGNDRGRPRQLFNRLSTRAKGKEREKDRNHVPGSGGNQRSRRNYNNAARDQELSMKNEPVPANEDADDEGPPDANSISSESVGRGRRRAKETTRGGGRRYEAKKGATHFRLDLSPEQSRVDSNRVSSTGRYQYTASTTLSKSHREFMPPPGQPAEIYTPRGEICHEHLSRLPSQGNSSIERYVRDESDLSVISLRNDKHQKAVAERREERLKEVVGPGWWDNYQTLPEKNTDII